MNNTTRSRGPLWRRGAMVLAAGLLASTGTLINPGAAQAATRTFTGVGVTGDGQGYVAVATSGETYAFGNVQHRGNPTGHSGIVDAAVTANGQGYVEVSQSGQVYAYGTVQHRGNPTGFSGSIVGIAVTADGAGYAAISSVGQVYAYGTAQHRGNPTGFSGTISGISVTANGSGYAAISTAGQVYAYGTVQHRGNPTGYSGSIVGLSVTADGAGYAALSSYGQVYAYGTVRYWGNGDPGSTSTSDVRNRIVSIAKRELADGARNHENGANCNFYSGALGSGATCGGGWRVNPWCADFARWVWGQSGAVTGGLTAGAVSFRTYGTNRGTWHAGNSLSGVAVGDVVGYNFHTSGTGDDHVGIVVAVGATSVTTIDGNYSDRTTQRTIAKGDSRISGFTSPVS